MHGAFAVIPPDMVWKPVSAIYPGTFRYVLLHDLYEPFILTIFPDGSKVFEPVWFEGEEH
jgi:hypothetical protein